MIKNITAKSNGRQELFKKIRYLKSQASYESVLNHKLKQGSYESWTDKLLSNYVVGSSHSLSSRKPIGPNEVFSSKFQTT